MKATAEFSGFLLIILQSQIFAKVRTFYILIIIHNVSNTGKYRIKNIDSEIGEEAILLRIDYKGSLSFDESNYQEIINDDKSTSEILNVGYITKKEDVPEDILEAISPGYSAR